MILIAVSRVAWRDLAFGKSAHVLDLATVIMIAAGTSDGRLMPSAVLNLGCEVWHVGLFTVGRNSL